MLRQTILTTAVGCALVFCSEAGAQMAPAMSGATSFDEPEMRRHGSGFFRPREPGQKHRRKRVLRAYR